MNGNRAITPEFSHGVVLGALMLSLPFQAYILPTYLLVALALTSFWWNWREGWPKTRRATHRFALVLWFVPLIFSAAYAPSFQHAGATIVEQLPLLAFPIAIGLGPTPTKKAIRSYLGLFVIGVILALTLALVLAAFRYASNLGLGNRMPVANLLGYHPLAAPLDMTASYLALYTAMAFFILWLPPLKESIHKTWRIAGLMFLFIMMFVLAARAQIAAFSMIFLGFTGYRFYRKFGRWKAIIGVIGLVTGMILLVTLPPRTRQRASETIATIRALSETQTDEYRDARLFIWNRTLQMIAERPIFGWGTGGGWIAFQQRCEEDLLDQSAAYSTRSIIENPFLFYEAFLHRYRSKSLAIQANSTELPADSAWHPLEMGKAYGFSLKTNHRTAGGLDIFNGSEKIGDIREEASGREGVQKNLFFIAEDTTLMLRKTYHPSGQLDVEGWTLYNVSETMPEQDKTSMAAAPPSILGNYMEVLEERFQIHNQYLSYALDFGILGALFLLAGLIAMIRTALRYRQPLLLAWILLIALSFVTEHILLRQSGLFFVALWGSFLMIPHRTETPTHSD